MPVAWILNQHVNGIGMVNIKRNREAKFRRQVLMNVCPIVAGVGAFVDTTVVLLIQHLWIGGVLHKAMNALSKLRIWIR